MATRERKKSGSASRSRKRPAARRQAKKSGFMGIGNLPATEGTTGQKVLRGGLMVLAAVLVGGAAGAYAGKYSGAAGLSLAMGGEFAPAPYKPYMQAIGLGMIVASPKMLEQTSPEAAAAKAAETGVSGMDALNAASFNEQGVSRLKNFASDMAEKVWADKPLKKYLGIGEMPVQYYDQPQANITQEDYNRLFEKALAEGREKAQVQAGQMAGYDQDNILAGYGEDSQRNVLAGLAGSMANIDL